MGCTLMSGKLSGRLGCLWNPLGVLFSRCSQSASYMSGRQVLQEGLQISSSARGQECKQLTTARVSKMDCLSQYWRKNSVLESRFSRGVCVCMCEEPSLPCGTASICLASPEALMTPFLSFPAADLDGERRRHMCPVGCGERAVAAELPWAWGRRALPGPGPIRNREHLRVRGKDPRKISRSPLSTREPQGGTSCQFVGLDGTPLERG